MDKRSKQNHTQFIHKRIWRRVALFMAAVVTFSTTYALILPAISLDNDAADNDPAIVIEEVVAPTPAPTPVPATPVPTAEPTAAPTEEPTPAPTEVPVVPSETEAPNETEAPAIFDEPSDEGDAPEPTDVPAVAVSAPTATPYPAQTFRADVGETWYLEIKAPEGALPQGAKLVFRSADEYADAEAVRLALGGEAAEVRLFDLYFTDASNVRLQPLAKVHVSLRCASLREAKDAARLFVLDAEHHAESVKLLRESVREDELTFETKKLFRLALAFAEDPAVPSEEPAPTTASVEELDLSHTPAEEPASVAEPTSMPTVFFSEEPEPTEEPTSTQAPAPTAAPVMPAAEFEQRVGTLRVSVAAPEGAFPQGTTMRVSAVTDKSALSAIGEAVSGEVVQVKAVDITFFTADGEEIEPALPIRVAIRDDMIRRADAIEVVHLDNENNASVVAQDNAGTAADEIAFTSPSFSVYGFVSVVIEDTIIDARGDTYLVTVTAAESAGVPADAKLTITELPADAREIYLRKTAAALGCDLEAIGYAKLLDISIVKDGAELQPAAPVEVTVTLLDSPADARLRVVHFGQSPEEVSCAVDGNDVTFAAAGFSVYAIVDGDSTVVTPRAVYAFYDENGNLLTQLPSQIIKNLETLTYVPAPQIDNKAFIGWFIYDRAANAWGEEIQFNTPITVLLGNETAIYGNSVVIQRPPEGTSDPDHVDVEVRARYTSNYGTVYFLTDDTQNGFDISKTVVVQDSRKVGIPDGGNQTTYTLPDKDTISTQSGNAAFTFVGWSMNPPPRINGVYNYYSNNDSREPITDVTVTKGNNLRLYPIFKQAHWLNFKTAPTGSGATYISPAYVANGQTASDKKPEDPDWRGYKFRYWTTTPTFDEETGEVYAFEEGSEPEPYNFDQPLSEDVTLYAYWESGYTTYTVIHWKQKVSDNKDADPADRTYEFAEQEQFEVKVGTVVTADDVDLHEYTGFHHREDDNKDSVSVTVDSSGATVYNVYYDRDTIYMKFYNGNGYAPSGEYNDSVWEVPEDGYSPATDDSGTQYALVDGEYVLLTREE